MSTLHEFDLILLSQLEDEEIDIIDNFVIDDYFIDYVNDQIGQNNKMYLIPSFVPANEAKKTDKPNTVGIDMTGMTFLIILKLLVETLVMESIAKLPKYNYEEFLS